MRLQFFGPFDKMVGKEIRLDLREPLPLRQVIRLLSLRHSAFASYAEKATDADLSAHVVFIRRGEPLKLVDPVEDSDVVQVLLPVTGG